MPKAKKNLPTKSAESVKIGEAAKIVGVSIDTLRRWEAKGYITSFKTPGGTRFYDVKSLLRVNPSSVKKVDSEKSFSPSTPSKGTSSIAEIKTPSTLSFSEKRIESDTPKLTLSDFESVNTGLNYQKYNKFDDVSPLKLHDHLDQKSAKDLKQVVFAPDFLNQSEKKLLNKKVLSLSFLSLLASAFILTAFLSLGITGSYMIAPDQTKNFFVTDNGKQNTDKQGFLATLLSPFNEIAISIFNVASPKQALALGLTVEKRDTLSLDSSFISKNKGLLSGLVLAESTSNNKVLTIGIDTQINGNLTATNGTFSEKLNSATLNTGYGDNELYPMDQAVRTSDTVTFNNLNLGAATNQLVLGSGSSALTINSVAQSTPRTAGIIALSSDDYFVFLNQTQTLTNKSISGSNNTLTNIPNSALSNSSITINNGSGIAGGGTVSLGGSLTLENTGVLAITGTANQVIASSSTGNVTLSLPQDIALTSIPTFAGLIFTGSSSGATTIAAAANTTSYTFTLPATAGTAGYILNTDGAGNTNWVAPSSAVIPWNSLDDPDGNLSLTMSAYTSTFTYNAATGTSNLFNLTDSTNNTGNGYLFNLTTASGSALKPLHISSVGVEALAVDAAGNVGIGLTNQTSKLQIAGSLTQSGGNASINASGTSSTNIGNSTGTLAIASGGLSTWANTAGNLTFSTLASGSITITAASGALNLQNDGSVDVNIAGGSAATGCTVINSTGDLSCSGNITGASTGTIGYWTRSGTTLSPSNAGDNITTSGAGTITSTGLLTGSAGITITGGTANINATGTSATNIGNSTGALVMASGGSSSWTNTSGNLTISTATSGALSFDSAAALTVGNTNATSISIGRTGVTTTNNGSLTSTQTLTASNGLTLTTGALNLTATSGALTLSGLSASSINTGANNIIFTSGNFNTTATGINSTAIGAITPSTGGFTTLASTGSTNIGTGAGSNNTFGNSTGTLAIASGGTSSWANTSGNLTISTVTSGSVTLTAAATALNLQNDGGIDVNIAGGSAATGCTVINSTGDLNCTGNISGSGSGTVGFWTRTGTTLSTANAGDNVTVDGTFDANGIFTIGDGGDAGSLSSSTLDIDATGALQINSSAGAISIGNDAVAQALNLGTGGVRTITIGNNSGATALNLTSGTGAQTFTSSVATGTTTSSAFVMNASSLSSGTALYLTSSATSGKTLDINATQTSGTIFNLAYGTTKVLSGDLTGLFVDLDSGQVDATNQNLTGVHFKIPTVTNTVTTGTKTLQGMLINFGSGAGINQNGAGGTLEYVSSDLYLPALTQTAGTLNAYGTRVTTPSSITTGGTAAGFYVSATGVGAGTLNGLSISSITGLSGTEDAISVGSGWDSVLKVSGTTIINGSGVTQVAGGGTGQSSYTTGDILYASNSSTLTKLNIGNTDGYVLQVASGVPVWGTVTGASCTNCLINNPSSDQFIAPTGQTTTGLTVRQTSTASPTDDIFQVTDSAGSTKYFYVDKDGNVSTGGVAGQTLTLTPLSDTTALTLVGTNVSTQALQYINSKNASATSGILNMAYGASQTLSGTVIGIRQDLSTNVTATNQSVTGQQITLPTVTNTNTSGVVAYTGLVISAGGGINQNGAGGTTTSTGVDITIPALTQTAGTLNAYGVTVTTPSSITTGGTASGFNVAATGIGSGGNLNGLNISTITPGVGNEYAINIGTGWDRDINFQNSAATVVVANGGTVTFKDSANNSLCTISDIGSTGDLSCTGSISGGGGTVGYWSKTGTTIAPATNTDDLAFGTANQLTISNAGLLTTSGGLTATGTVNLNVTGSGATNIGSATAGAITIASGAASSFTTTNANLTLSTSAGTGANGRIILSSALASGNTTTEALSFKTSTNLGASDEVAQFGDSGADFITLLGNGNFGIGDTTPSALLSVGNGDLFTVDATGSITAIAGYTQTSGNFSATGGTTSALSATTTSITGSTTLNLNSTGSGTTNVGTGSGLTNVGSGSGNTNIGTGSGNVAIGNGTGTLAITSAGGLNVTTGGAVTGVTTLVASTSVTSPSYTGTGAVNVSSGGSSDLTLNSASDILKLSDPTIQFTDTAATLTLDALRTAGDKTVSLTNSDATYRANLSVEGQVRIGNYTSGEAATLTPTGKGALYFNSTENQLYVSNDGTTWSTLGGNATVPLLNNSGGTVAQYSIVIQDITVNSAFTTTTTPYSKRVIGVMASGATCSAATICNVIVGGKTTVRVSNATSRGDYLYTSTVAGQALASSTQYDGLLGVALTSAAAGGTVDVVLIPQLQAMASASINKGASYNEYRLLANQYTGEGIGANSANISPKGIFFDNFLDNSKYDSTNSTTGGPWQETAVKGNPSGYAPYRAGLVNGQTYSSATTDNTGNTYLGNSNVADTKYYDRTRDSSAEVLVNLGVDPNWYNGVTLSVGNTTQNFSQNDTNYSQTINPNLSTSYNGSLVLISGQMATAVANPAKTVYVTIKSSTASGLTYDWTDGTSSNTAQSAVFNTATTLTTSGAVSTGVSVTFTKANYNNGDVFRIASWFIENTTGNTIRGTKQQFPERSYIIADTTFADIIDADTQKLWMRFTQASSNLLYTAPATARVVSSVDALNGKIYVGQQKGTDTNGQLYSIDFSTENTAATYASGTVFYLGGIAQRNSALGYSTTNNTTVTTISSEINDIAAQVVPNKPKQVITVSGWSYIQGDSTQAIEETFNFPYKFNNTPTITTTANGYSGSAPSSLANCSVVTGTTVTGNAYSTSTTGSSIQLAVDTGNTFSNTNYFCYTWTATGEVSPRQYAAVATGTGASDVAADGGTTVINQTDGDTRSFYWSVAYDWMKHVQLTSTGQLYYTQMKADTTGNISVWYNALTRTGTTTGNEPLEYNASSIPAINQSSNYTSLYVTEGTSTIDGKSNTIYAGTTGALNVIQEKQSGNITTLIGNSAGRDEQNGSVKYYKFNNISEEMVGDIRGMWPLASNNTLSLTDASIKGNNLTNNSSVTAVSGVRGVGATFSSNYFSVADTASLDIGAGQWSVGAWIKTSTAVAGCVICKGTTGTFSYDLFVGVLSSTKPSLRLYQAGGTTYADVTGTTSVTDGNWHYIVATWNPTGTTSKMYVDGILQATNTSVSGTLNTDSTAALNIGRRADGSLSYTGSMDEPFITANELSGGQVKHMYDVGYRALQSHSTTLGGGLADTNQQLPGSSNLLSDAKVDFNNQYLYAATNHTTDGAVSKIDLNADTNVKTFTISPFNQPSGGTNLINLTTKSLAVGYQLEAVASTDSGVKSMAPDNNANGTASTNLISETTTTANSFNQAYVWVQGVIDTSDSSNTFTVSLSNDGGSNYYTCNLINTNSNVQPYEYEYFCQLNSPGTSLKSKIAIVRGSTKTSTYVTRYGVAWIDSNSSAATPAGNGFYTGSNASVASDSYVQVAHNQGTNDLITNGWIYDEGKWKQIDGSYKPSYAWDGKDLTRQNFHDQSTLYKSSELTDEFTKNMLEQGLFFETFEDGVKIDSTASTGSTTGIMQSQKLDNNGGQSMTQINRTQAGRAGLSGGQTYNSSTADIGGNANYLGDNATNDTFYYNRVEKDSSPEVQVNLGIDPNWANGVTLSVANTSQNFSQNDTNYSQKVNPNLSTSYNGSLVKVTGSYASSAKTINMTVLSQTETTITAYWTDGTNNSATAGQTFTFGTSAALSVTGTGGAGSNPGPSATFTKAQYNTGDVFKIASWYTEPLNSATRGNKQAFPERAYLIGDGANATSNIEIIDADTQRLWMRFQAGSFFVIHSSYTPNSVSALNGKLYTALIGGGYSQVDFTFDRTINYSNLGSRDAGYIANRNAANSYAVINATSPLLNDNTGYDLSAAVIPNQPKGQITVSGWGYIQGSAAQFIQEPVSLPYKFNTTPNVVLSGAGLKATTAPATLAECGNSNLTDGKVYSLTTTAFNAQLATTDGTNFSTTTYYCYTWTATGEVSPRQYVGVGTAGGINIVNETDQSSVSTTTSGDYGPVYRVALLNNGNFYYYVDNSGANGGLSLLYNAASQTAACASSGCDKTYKTATGASTGTPTGIVLNGGSSSNLNSLYVTQGTSTIDGKSNTIYFGNTSGVSVVQEKQSYATGSDGLDEKNGSVKYYTKDNISEEMVGDIRGMWPLSANGAISMTDASVKADTLTNNNTATAVTGVRGMATTFNGTTQYLSCTDAACGGTSKLDGNGTSTTGWSYGAWVKTNATGVTQGVVSKYDGNNLRSWRMQVLTTNKVNVQICSDGVCTVNGSVTSNTALATGTWYYAVGVYDGSTLSVYINGQKETSVAYASGVPDTTSSFLVGAGDYGSGTVASFFSGAIDEPFVTNNALTAGQIKHMYDVGYRALQSHSTSLGGGAADTNQQLGFISTGSNQVRGLQTDYNNQYLYAGTNSTTLGAVSKIDLTSDTNVKTFNSSANVPAGGTLLVDEDTISLAVGYDLEIVGSAASGVKSMSPSASNYSTTGNYVSKTMTLPKNIASAVLWLGSYLDASDTSGSLVVKASNDGGAVYDTCTLLSTDSNPPLPEKEYACDFTASGSSLKVKLEFTRGSTKANVYATQFGISWLGQTGFRIEQADNNTVRLYNYTGGTQNLRLDVITGLTTNNHGGVSLAPAAADSDSSTSSNSIWINKSSMTGNLLKLQQGGTDVHTVDFAGNITAGVTYDTPLVSSTTNGTGTNSTTMVLTSATGFTVGRYIELTNTASVCSGAATTVCYAKITNISTNTLTISPALSWATGKTVKQVYMPEIGGTNSADTLAGTPLASRFGRGYFVDGIVTGNGSTYYTDTAIISGAQSGIGTAAALNLKTNNTLASSDEVFQITNNTTNLLTVLGSGNVGIGTTAPVGQFNVVNSSPTTKHAFNLEQASTTTSMATDWANINIANTDTTTNNWSKIAFTDGATANYAGAIGLQFTDHTNDYGDLAFFTRSAATSFSEKMRIMSSGNVGIGTSAPARSLDISGTNGSATAGRLRFSNAADATYYAEIGRNQSTGNFDFIQSYAGTPITSVVFEQVTGYVGIGTTDPGFILDISQTATTVTQMLRNGTTTGTTATAAQRFLHNGRDAGKILSGRESDYTTDANGDSYLSFSTALNSGDTEYMRITSAGNVGIGATNPSDKLTVFGTGTGTAFTGGVGISVNDDGYASGVGHKFGLTFGISPTNTHVSGVQAVIENTTTATMGLAFTTYTNLDFGGSPHESMRINSAGNLGIGTTAPTGRLDVSNGLLSIVVGADSGTDNRTNSTAKIARITGFHYTNAEEPVGLVMSNSDATNNTVNFGGGSTLVNAATILSFYTAANNTTVTGTERMRINASGNVTIGSSADVAPLYVVTGSGGAFQFTQSGTPGGYVGNFSLDATGMKIGHNSNIRDIQFQTNSTTGLTLSGSNLTLLTGGTFKADNFASNTSAGMVFNSVGQTGGNNFQWQTSATARMVMNSSGQVGIGTTAPAADFQVTHANSNAAYDIAKFGASSYSSGTNFTKRILSLGDITVSGSFDERVDLRAVDIGDVSYTASNYIVGAQGARFYGFRMGNLTIAGTPLNDLVSYGFYMGGINSPTGGSGLNPTNYGMYLGNVTGGTSYSIFSAGGTMYHAGSVGIGTSAPSVALHVVGNGRFTAVGSGTFSNNLNITADGTLTTATSDRRLKENLVPLDNSLDKISSLNGYKFSWISDSEHRTDIGLMAQDVEAVFPEIVFTNPTDGYKGINYTKFTPILLEAIKEVNQKVNAVAAASNMTVDNDGFIEMPKIKSDKVKLAGLQRTKLIANANALDLDNLTSVGNLASSESVQDYHTDLADTLNTIIEVDKAQTDKIAALEGRQASDSAVLGEIANKQASDSALLAQTKQKTDSLTDTVASTSANLANLSSQIEGLLSSINGGSATPSANTADNGSNNGLTPPEELLSATSSATLANITVTEKTSTKDLSALNVDVSGALKSLGDTFLGRTVIAGDVSFDGTLAITTGNTINSIGTLYLQNSPLAEKIDLFSGKIEISKEGKLVAASEVQAPVITTNKLTILNTPIASDSASVNAALISPSIGKSKVTAFTQRVIIQTTAVTQKSKVFLTPIGQTDKILAVENIIPGQSFEVVLSTPNVLDTNFNWWIVESDQENN